MSAQMQEIIVYRNPAEAAMYHSLQNNDNIFPIFVGMVTFVLSWLIINAVMCKIKPSMQYKRNHKWINPQWVILCISGVITYLLMWKMWL